MSIEISIIYSEIKTITNLRVRKDYITVQESVDIKFILPRIE